MKTEFTSVVNDFIEMQIRLLIEKFGFDTFCTSFHNACIFGQVFETGVNGGITEPALSELFEKLEGLNDLAKRI